MGQVSSKLRKTERGFSHWCPACKETHGITTAEGKSPRWDFDGNLEAPTFSPSVRITGKQTVVDDKGEWSGEWVRDANGNAVDMCCHYVLTAGVINFCGDCTHELKGQSVPLPDLPQHARD